MITKVSSIEKSVKETFIVDKGIITDEQDNMINIELEKLRIDLKASRVFHMVYHNGMVSLDGVGYRRASVMHSSKADYLETYLSTMTNIPMSVYSYWNTQFKTAGHVYYEDVEKIKESDRGLYYLFITKHIGSSYFEPYFGNDLEPRGFIGVEYINIRHTITPDESRELNTVAHIIRGIIYNVKTRE